MLLPKCPQCGNTDVSHSKTFSVVVEPSKGEHGIVERKVGMYACRQCGTNFPTVISRQRYLIVTEEQLRSIERDLADAKTTNEGLETKIQTMINQQNELQRAIEKAMKEGEVSRLETKLAELEQYVEHLRKEKGELEQRTTGSGQT